MPRSTRDAIHLDRRSSWNLIVCSCLAVMIDDLLSPCDTGPLTDVSKVAQKSVDGGHTMMISGTQRQDAATYTPSITIS